VKEIKEARPELNVIKVGKDDPITRDIRGDRVRVFVDPETNKVHSIPRIG